MNAHTLKREIWLPRPLTEIFTFFADARNLELITPPWLHFKILNPEEIIMKQGVRIDYSLRFHRIPISWQAEITRWEPPRHFTDVQRRGPYRMWVHEHWFEQRGDGTRVVDELKYAPPGGNLVNKLIVHREVEKIFDFRAGKLKSLFPAG